MKSRPRGGRSSLARLLARSGLLLGLAAFAVALTGCSKPVPMSMEPLTPLTLAPGQTVRVGLQVDRKGNKGPIQIEVVGVPEGITAASGGIPAGKSEGELEVAASEQLGDEELKARLQVIAKIGAPSSTADSRSSFATMRMAALGSNVDPTRADKVLAAKSAPAGKQPAAPGGVSAARSTDNSDEAAGTMPDDTSDDLPETVPGTMASATPETTPETMPRTMPNAMPGAKPASMPGTMPRSMPGAKPANMPGAKPASMPGTKPASMPGAKPGSMPSAQPGARPNTMPGAMPGALPKVPRPTPSVASPATPPSPTQAEETLEVTVTKIVLPRFRPPAETTIEPGQTVAIGLVVDRATYHGPMELEVRAPRKFTCQVGRLAADQDTATLQVRASQDVRDGKTEVRVFATVLGRMVDVRVPLRVERTPFDMSALQVRTWTDKTGGHKTEGRLLGVQDGVVRLKRTDGNTVTVPLEQLSLESRAFVREHTLSSGEVKRDRFADLIEKVEPSVVQVKVSRILSASTW